MTAPATDRRTAITDAAIRVLATAGGRGLTHRSVDRDLGLPDGSTGNYFPTRAALLMACAERLAELDLADTAAAAATGGERRSSEDVGQMIAAFLLTRLKGQPRARQLARVELLLEGTRSPRLAALLADLRERFVGAVAALLATTGSADPDDHARAVVACFDGLVLDQLLYRRTAVERDRLAAHLTRVVAADGAPPSR